MILKDYYDFFLEKFFNKYSINNKINNQIFLENLNIFNEILNNNYTSYINKMNNDLNSIDKNINIFNNEINNFYLDIIKESNNYDFYSIDEENLNLTFISNYNSLNNSFNNYLEKYFNFSKNYNFHNSFTKALRNIYNLQIIDYGEKIKQFSNNFNLELFNASLSLDQLIIDELRKDYDNFEFSFLYE